MKRVLKYIITFVVLGLLVALISWQLGKNKSTMETNTEIANQKMTVFPVSIVSPKTEDVSQNFSISGEFKPMHQLNFVSETSGRVTAVRVENGDYVKKGQVIAQLDNEQTRIDLKLAEANLEKAENDLDKFTILADGGAATKQQLEDIKLAKISAETRVETLKRQLKVSTIVSPISGTINSLSLEVGSFVAPGTMIAEIVDVSRLKMSVTLLDNEVVRVTEGMKVSIEPDLYANSPMEGEVSFISSKADGSGKYVVEIEFSNKGANKLKAGMTGSANFVFSGDKNAVMIPIKCLIGSVQDPSVWIVQGDSVSQRKIAVGGIYGDKIELLSGVEPNEQVVETGLGNLSEGSKITIIE